LVIPNANFPLFKAMVRVRNFFFKTHSLTGAVGRIDSIPIH
jgi:hypothetical protein